MYIFDKDSPIWNILFLVIGALLTYFLSTKQKQKDTIIEAKKAFLEKRIEAHMKLLDIIASARMTTGPSAHVTVNYFIIFKDRDTMNLWFDNVLQFMLQNKPLLSKKVIIQTVALNNGRKIIEFIRTKNKMNTEACLVNFGIKYFKDFQKIFSALEDAIQYFFEKEINLKYSFPVLSETDYNEAENFIKSLHFIKDNITHEEYFARFEN